MSSHIFLIASEESGDRLGAPLIAAIRHRAQGQVHFSSIGGAHMAAEGVPSLFPLGDLAIIGFAAIPASLPKILRRIREAADAVISAKPDALVIIDSPEFTHRVAKRVRAKLPEISIIDYVCPSVWAWRPGRARAMRSYVDHVLALLPFEPKVMAELAGPPCTYVGHPLIERLDELRPKDLEKRLRFADPPLLLVLPGSREGEIRRMAAVFGAAVARVVEQFGPIEVVADRWVDQERDLFPVAGEHRIAAPLVVGPVHGAGRSRPRGGVLDVHVVDDPRLLVLALARRLAGNMQLQPIDRRIRLAVDIGREVHFGIVNRP